MRPGPDYLRQPQILDRDSTRLHGSAPAEGVPLLGDEQRLVIGALQSRPHGMTLRQLEVSLSWPTGTAESIVGSLLERHLVAQLNTLIPSYVYRYGGVDLNAG